MSQLNWVTLAAATRELEAHDRCDFVRQHLVNYSETIE
jgi:hypothetical protein